MPVFVSSTSATNQHGAFAVETTPPAILQPQGSSNAAIIGQFPWGPDPALYEPTSAKDRLDRFAPPGMSRTGSGYLSIIRKSWQMLKVGRVLGTTAAKATKNLANITPTNIVQVDAKYKGAAGNSITLTVSAATDGDANHFNLTATVTGPSGTTTDLFENLNYSGTGADSVPVFTNTLLIGAITKLAAGRPINGSTTMATGSDGTVVSGDYVGTAGTGDKGIAAAENDKSIRHIFADDPGNSLRAAVNAGLNAHATARGDRIAYMNGDSGLSVAATRTDVGNYRSVRNVYVDPWARIFDDVDGTLRLVPPASFAANVASQLPPSTSIAWKGTEVIAMLSGIRELEQARGDAAVGNSNAGIATLILEEEGGFTFEAGYVTSAPNDPAKKTLARTRTGDYIALAFTKSVRGLVDAPNVPVLNSLLVGALQGLLDTLKQAQNVDPIHNVHILAYEILPLSSVNTPALNAAGKFLIPLKVKTSSSMEQIYLLIEFGETVTVSAA